MPTGARWILWMALVLAVPACAASGTPVRTGGPRPAPNVITFAQVESANQLDAYSLIHALRPHWLRKRGVSSMTRVERVQVYQDGTRVGGPEVLRQISTRVILSIEYYDGRTATQKWGSDHGNGAIVVLTRRG